MWEPLIFDIGMIRKLTVKKQVWSLLWRNNRIIRNYNSGNGGDYQTLRKEHPTSNTFFPDSISVIEKIITRNGNQ